MQLMTPLKSQGVLQIHISAHKNIWEPLSYRTLVGPSHHQVGDSGSLMMVCVYECTC